MRGLRRLRADSAGNSTVPALNAVDGEAASESSGVLSLTLLG